MKFTYSYVFKLAGGATLWKSVKWTITTLQLIMNLN